MLIAHRVCRLRDRAFTECRQARLLNWSAHNVDPRSYNTSVAEDDILHEGCTHTPIISRRQSTGCASRRSRTSGIVAKLDDLLARSRRAKEELAAIPALLERYRQSVLAAAFRGDLTADWRAASGFAFDWPEVELASVANGFSYGSAAKSAKSGSMPVLRMGNIQDGKLDWTDLVYTSDPEECVKYRLTDGDLVFNRTNSPELVGKSAVYRGSRPAIYAGYLIRVQCSPTLIPEYVCHHINSSLGRSWRTMVKSDGVSQSNINAKKLAAYSFLLPPLPEQQEIVRRIDAAFARIDAVRESVAAQLASLEALERAILTRAFRGELVPQDPNDEPASVLLARIRAEREAAPVKSRRTKRTSRS
ncbi:MAG: restriction endonuclease subunit S [Polyangiales bacterium]